MNARITRIHKEARALFWPWCVVTIAGGLPLVLPQSHPIVLGSNIRELGLVGFFGGIHLLAILSLGNEFQHRTLSLLLSQPVSRMEIWREKLSVTFVAVLSAALVCCYAWRSELQQDPKLWVLAGVYLITAIPSATFWTLFARSTLGGFALNIFFPSSLVQIVVFNWEQILGPNPSPARSITALWTVAFGAFCLAGAMLWLGGRKLARFQVTGGMAGDDLLMAGPTVMPEALAGLFRCRPTGPFLNLVRKELRLLRPLWLIALLLVLYLTVLTLLRLFPDAARMHSNFTGWVIVLSPLVAIPVMAILAGCLSLGEERTSGTHSWHLTLPVPARRQWLIKLLVALFTGFVCGVLLPDLVLLAGGNLSFGGPVYFVDPRAAFDWMYTVPLLTLVSFWCACAVKGTVRAALWVFPIMGALLLVAPCDEWVARELAPFAAGLMHLVVSAVVSRFDPLAHFRFVYAVSSINLLPRYGRLMQGFGSDPPLWLAPTLLFTVIQSYWMFRTELRDSTLSVIRNLLPPATVAFLCIFSLGTYFAFVWHAKGEMYLLFRETHDAIEKIQSGTAKLDATHPLQLTVEDLAKASRLSPRTRRWLRDSSITVVPDEPHRGRNWGRGFSAGIGFGPDKAHAEYLATIHLASGSDCKLLFKGGGIAMLPEKPGGIRQGVLSGVCD